MRRFTLYLFLLLVGVLWGGVTQAAEVRVLPILAHDPAFSCNTGEHVKSVVNPLGRPIRVVGVNIWMGMSEHGVADYSARLEFQEQATGRRNWMYFIGWDHYQPPTTHSGFYQDYGQHYMTVAATDTFLFTMSCSGYPNITAGGMATIHYTEVPPLPIAPLISTVK